MATTKRAPLTFETEKVAPVPAPAKQTSLHANAKTEKQAKKKTGTSRAGQRFIAGHVSPEALKQFTLLRVQQDKEAQELLVEAINDLFAKYGLSRIA